MTDWQTSTPGDAAPQAGLPSGRLYGCEKLRSWRPLATQAPLLFIDLTEDGVRELVLGKGLVDVKVCAVDDDWSGLKLMVRKELRT